MSRRTSHRTSEGRRRTQAALLLALTIIVLLGRSWLSSLSSPTPDVAAAPDLATNGVPTVAELYESRRSGDVVEVAATVDALLPDDDDGSRHQRLIVRLDAGQTLLIAHNIDLAPRVPVQVGDRVAVRGQYEWNDRGGLLHWTHHDPAGVRPGGWIDFGGRRYR